MEARTEVHAPGSHPPPPIFQIHVAPAAARPEEAAQSQCREDRIFR